MPQRSAKGATTYVAPAVASDLLFGHFHAQAVQRICDLDLAGQTGRGGIGLEREVDAGPIPTIGQFKEAAKAAGMELQFQDLDELARHALEGIRTQQFVIMYGHGETEATLKDRAERIGRGELPFDLASLPMM